MEICSPERSRCRDQETVDYLALLHISPLTFKLGTPIPTLNKLLSQQQMSRWFPSVCFLMFLWYIWWAVWEVLLLESPRPPLRWWCLSGSPATPRWSPCSMSSLQSLLSRQASQSDRKHWAQQIKSHQTSFFTINILFRALLRRLNSLWTTLLLYFLLKEFVCIISFAAF